MKNWFWTRLVPSLASVKVAMGLVAFFLTYGAAGRDPLFPYVFYFFFLLAFGSTASLLLLGGRGDRRALALGGFFLTAATAWSNKPLGNLAELWAGQEVWLLRAIDALELDAFIAFYLWMFARDFPHPPPSVTVRSRMNIFIRVSAAAGLLLFGLNLLRFTVGQVPGGEEWWQGLGAIVPQRGKGAYYTVIMALTAGAFAVLPWKAWALKGADQRRLRLFLQMLALSFGPMLFEILLELFVPPYTAFTDRNPRLKLGIIIGCSAVVLTLPFTVPYAVLVHRVLDVKLIARRALQYLLARSSVLFLVAVPIVALGWYLAVHSDESLKDLFSGPRFFLLLSGILMGIITLRYRKTLLDAIDRRFFREQYDARQILTLLVERIRSINEVASLASLVSREIDLALHLEGVSMMVVDPRSEMLTDPRSRARRLDASSQLALLISNASDPLEVNLEDSHSPLARLDEKDRHWLVDSNFRLIVPILARDGSLLGIVGLGEKKSGLPFLKEDRQLLHAIASSAAWVLELEKERIYPPQGSWRDAINPDPHPPENAKECSNCGALYQAFTVFCINCSRRLELSHVPFVLPGKFRFERRIGVGGMGLVYRGSDLALGRPVAIKTLRRVSPEDAMRLRHEARTAAAVSHPHLAPVYGLETWKGTPMLVMELLEGGTLAQRVEREKRLSPVETVELGIAMTGALAQLHSADILHRDIKPSNIGYTRDATPKLMDFGIARMMFDLSGDGDAALLASDEDDSALLPPASPWDQSPGSPIVTGRQLAGTLAYLSPEAVQGEAPDSSFDLWGLAIVLYECLLGRKIFTGADSRQIMARIKSGRVPEFSQVLPGYDGPLGDFFRSALHKSRARRPESAQEMRQQLVVIREHVASLGQGAMD